MGIRWPKWLHRKQRIVTVYVIRDEVGFSVKSEILRGGFEKLITLQCPCGRRHNLIADNYIAPKFDLTRFTSEEE